ncbi:S49 family peptidase [Tessaracoccus oleiagri]|uniref:Protease-4 n=1 Tax=Tessaracoccus oleiagri TaxID=686624 RepID=A0A1G9J916_9ACTN|nr:S49 family peptidase [Tessaracoccus oleiagri]SDL33713.1 protease-4 [Tessaracoccus oleiagri]
MSEPQDPKPSSFPQSTHEVGAPPQTGRSGPTPQWQQPAPPASRPGYAPAPPKPRSGFGRGFGTGMGFALGLGAVMVVGSIVAFLMALASLATMSVSTPAGVAATEVATIWGDPDAEGSLRAIDIAGAIMADSSDGALLGSGTYGYEVASTIDSLTTDDSAGLVLLVNTPGGSIPGSKAIADAVTRYQERTGQPVLVHVASMSASGGVYATATADEILADHGALVGSIGVLSGPFQQYTNVTAIGSTILTAGIEAESITQEYLSAGKGKDFGNPFRAMTEEERTRWLEMLDYEYGQFVSHVAEHRGIDEATIRDEMGAGMFANNKSLEYGLIDGVMGRDEFFRHAAETAGLDPDDTRVDAFTYPQSFWSGLLGIERIYGESPVAAQGSGVTPSLSQAICGPTSVLAYHGPLTAVCG